DYHKYHSSEFIPDHVKPFILKGTGTKGVVLSHGFLSAPIEIRKLAESLNAQGYWVYGIRLPGHGTAPEDLQTITYKDWMNAYRRGYNILRQHCDDVTFGGFSTGGTIALALASMHQEIKTVFAINPPLSMRDIHASMAPAVNMWNKFAGKLHMDFAKLEYIDQESENPFVNYTRIYLNGLDQLDQLMEFCEDNIEKIKSRVMILHSDNDPTVNPHSSKLIFEKLGTEDKTIISVEADNHIIVQDEGSENVFKIVANFLNKNTAEKKMSEEAVCETAKA
ncbi:MAG: alpha/beta fold hydrolase, partial [Lentisphaeria bacterium]|nr:alpha/beta fold hydrolase [Lentisphaeria bacterium]NQZ70409.1 alpha/beta fold hydrolase [Lentisphaeria bacterium]